MVYAFSYPIDILFIDMGIYEKVPTYAYPIQYNMDLYIAYNPYKTPYSVGWYKYLKGD